MAEMLNVDEFSIDGPEWLKRRLTPERLVHICEQVKQDKGRKFLSNVLDNIPIALIVLLPIMAFVLKALYPLSRRYYVEHLSYWRDPFRSGVRVPEPGRNVFANLAVRF